MVTHHSRHGNAECAGGKSLSRGCTLTLLIHIVKVDRTLLTVNLARELAAHGIDLEVIIEHAQGPLRVPCHGRHRQA